MVMCLLLFASTLLKSVLAKNCLECFQCSDKKEPYSFCDDNYWHILTDKKRENLIVGCPPEVSSFCVKLEASENGNRTTERGCSGDHDSRGNELIEGCIEFKENDITYNVCLCASPMCNSIGRNSLRLLSLLFMILILVKDY